jgi:hypothetical protein
MGFCLALAILFILGVVSYGRTRCLVRDHLKDSKKEKVKGGCNG